MGFQTRLAASGSIRAWTPRHSRQPREAARAGHSLRRMGGLLIGLFLASEPAESAAQSTILDAALAHDHDRAAGFIIDDDDPILISVSEASVREGDHSTTPLTFLVQLSAPSARGFGGIYDSADHRRALR